MRHVNRKSSFTFIWEREYSQMQFGIDIVSICGDHRKNWKQRTENVPCQQKRVGWTERKLSHFIWMISNFIAIAIHRDRDTQPHTAYDSAWFCPTKKKCSILITKIRNDSHSFSACLASYGTETVMQLCHGRRRCTISADRTNFGNPCRPESRVYLKVVYTCSKYTYPLDLDIRPIQFVDSWWRESMQEK